MSDLDLVGKLISLEEAISAAAVPHAFGGAIALAAYAEPRGTADLDLGVFLDSDATERILSVLGTLGMDTDVDVDLIKAGDWGRLYWGATPVDFFFSYTPMHFEAQRRVRSLAVRGAEIPVLGPEDVIGLKAVFNREKDWVDVDSILREQKDIDVDVVRRWLETTNGDSRHGLAERVGRFNELARRRGHATIARSPSRRRRWMRHTADEDVYGPSSVAAARRTPQRGRRPAGSPAGGQFTGTPHPEANEVELDRPPPESE